MYYYRKSARDELLKPRKNNPTRELLISVYKHSIICLILASQTNKGWATLLNNSSCTYCLGYPGHSHHTVLPHFQQQKGERT